MAKKFSPLILLAFWSFTWHAYAVGALSWQKIPVQQAAQGVFERDFSSGDLNKIRDADQFKRRPFLIKVAAVVPDPSVGDKTYFSSKSSVPVERTSLRPVILPSFSLRAPPSPFLA